MRASTLLRWTGHVTCLCLGLLVAAARAQTFRYQAEPRAGNYDFSYAAPEDAPRMMFPPPGAPPYEMRPDYDSRHVRRAPARYADDRVRLAGGSEPIPPGVRVEPFIEDAPPGPPGTVYEGYEGAYPGGPVEPQLAGEPFLQESCANCDDCDPCGPCYMKRFGHYLCGAAADGAFCENLSLFSGKQGFKGPVDQGVNGDFGYNAGGNWAFPLFPSMGVGFQIGANLVASDFEGRSGPLGHRRYQFFGTMGVFHRAMCGRGFQMGAAVDYLRDDFYIQMDLTQVRAELSYQYCYHEVGFWGAFQGNTSTHVGQFTGDDPLETFSFQGTSQYNVFYRYQFCSGTYCRTWAGLSDHGDGIFGSDATIYISPKVGLVATYNYLLPRNDPTVPLNVKESWNLAIALVWYPGYKKCDSWTNPYRPLFYVADNGWFLVRQAE
jgi:hypothetical protein